VSPKKILVCFFAPLVEIAHAALPLPPSPSPTPGMPSVCIANLARRNSKSFGKQCERSSKPTERAFLSAGKMRKSCYWEVRDLVENPVLFTRIYQAFFEHFQSIFKAQWVCCYQVEKCLRNA
jgi:hypothetical protein